jgi:hypothetical protein
MTASAAIRNAAQSLPGASRQLNLLALQKNFTKEFPNQRMEKGDEDHK